MIFIITPFIQLIKVNEPLCKFLDSGQWTRGNNFPAFQLLNSKVTSGA